jgi:hypothetical protein|tara:strand:+ start:1823 stop:2488 length:666 start_codon:yes stop_codon:yes gene_type:complete
MFKLVVQLLILIYLILMVYSMVSLQKFNINGFIIETNDIYQIKQNHEKLNPTHTHLESGFDINSVTEFDYLQDIINYKVGKPTYVFKNHELFEKVLSEDIVFHTSSFNDSQYHFPGYKALSVISGRNSIPLKKCIHNHNIIGILDGEAIFYLFNPKHKDEILNKENDEIKKWGHKKILKKNDILIIPPYWSYIQEIENGIIQYHLDVDTYFTFIPNFFKGE